MLNTILRRAPISLSSTSVSGIAPLGSVSVLCRSFSNSFQYFHEGSGNAPYKEDRILQLNNIYDNKGARKKEKRVGRGEGGGLGKTSGRGMKGRLARKRQGSPWFEGGQTTLFKRIRKIGSLRSPIAEPLSPLSLGKIMDWVKQGRLDIRKVIDMKAIKESGIMRNFKYGVKVIGTGYEQVNVPINLEVSWSSPQAKESVEKAGGTITHRFFNRVTLRAHLYPNKFPILPRRDGVPKPKMAHRYPGLVDVTYLHRGLKEEEEQLELEKAKAAMKKKVKK